MITRQPTGSPFGEDGLVRDEKPNEAAAEVETLIAALKPFADLAGPINGEEGRPTSIGVMTGDGEHDELELRSHVGRSSRTELLYGHDFRQAADAIAAWNARLSRPTPEAEVEAVASVLDQCIDTFEHLAKGYDGHHEEDGSYKKCPACKAWISHYGHSPDCELLVMAKRARRARAILSRSPAQGNPGLIVSCASSDREGPKASRPVTPLSDEGEG